MTDTCYLTGYSKSAGMRDPIMWAEIWAETFAFIRFLWEIRNVAPYNWRCAQASFAVVNRQITDLLNAGYDPAVKRPPGRIIRRSEYPAVAALSRLSGEDINENKLDGFCGTRA